jgi:polar amino acid transport system substrate-binding protein
LYLVDKLLCILLTTFFCVNSVADARGAATPRIDEIHIAVHRYYPYYVDGVGISADLFRAAFATQGIQVVLHEFPIMRGISKMFNHEMDAFSPGTLFISRKKDQEQLHIVPYMTINVDWFYAGNNSPLTQQDFTGKILATPTSQDKPQAYYVPFIKRGMRYITVEQPERQVRLLMSGRVDFITLPRLSGLYQLFNNGVEDFDAYGFASMMNPFAINMAFAKDNPRADILVPAFRQGLQIIIENGTYLTIHEKYWGKGNVPRSVLFESLQSYGVDKLDMQLLLRQHQYRQ